MRILLVVMMLAFTAAGLLVGGISLREFFRRLGSRQRFERADGVVMQVKSKVMRSTNRRRLKLTILNVPVIRFTTQAGDDVTFTSETGDTGRQSRYSPGQRVPVRYDPIQEFRPMIDSWWGIWMPTIAALLGGLGFLAGAALIWLAFGDRILGP